MIKNSTQIQILQASQNMLLTNGETYSKMVYLGINDSSSNWQQVPQFEGWQDPIINDVPIEEQTLQHRVSILQKKSEEADQDRQMLIECILQMSQTLYS